MNVTLYSSKDVAKEDLKVIDVEDMLIEKVASGEWIEPEHPLSHDFFAGIYVRTLKMSKNTLMTGARHRFKTCNFLLKGSLSVFMEDGSGVRRLTAPSIFESEKHIKKLIYCHTDVIFTTVHPTEETDVDKIEDLFIISEEEYMRGAS